MSSPATTASTGGRAGRIALAVVLVLALIAALVLVLESTGRAGRTKVTAYFDNTNGLFPGDDVVILGVPVGTVETITPQYDRAIVTFSFDDRYQVPVDVSAAILSPSLVTSRAIQLTPVYRSGPALESGAVIPLERTAVPVEWDDFRAQLDKLTESLQPVAPDGTSPLGSAINTGAANFRGNGEAFREAVIRLSQAFSALGDHSGDLFGSVRNLSLLVSALQTSTDLMRELNVNLADVTGLLADDPTEIDRAIAALNIAVGDVQRFVSTNSDSLGTAFDRLNGVSQALFDSREDLKQTLHVLPNTLQNFINIYQPAQGALSGALVVNNFANPLSFLCSAVQAASRLGAEQSAKLCVQYLAPILKNRQYNFPPIGQNLAVGAQARPNEITYSENWLNPDYVPPAVAPAPVETPTVQPVPADAALPAEMPAPAEGPAGAPLPAEVAPTDPTAGLSGMMLPQGATP